MSALPEQDEHTPDKLTVAGKQADLQSRRADIAERSQLAEAKQHKKEKKTAMERVLELLDDDGVEALLSVVD